MNMMTSIASMATEMSAAKFAMSYSVGIIKKDMETQEQMAQNLLEMLPPVPSGAQFIDTYA